MATKPTVHYKVFEDNNGAIKLVKVPRMRPRTMFIDMQCHHFWQYVDYKKKSILLIDTEDHQCAKLLSLVKLTKL